MKIRILIWIKGFFNFSSSSKRVKYHFILKIDNLEVGHLKAEDGLWKFWYSESFKEQTEYRRLTGFRDLNKVYENTELWPFFKIRIPGLKQPMIKEIIEEEKLDSNNIGQLLQRFGTRSTTNPYILDVA